ncbi:MAG TPA: dockerin type I domain-containing protein, partial [Planctomycetota bacterium]|nr:dockerin type I domain-containing protein [Planctomycetota bacterium]
AVSATYCQIEDTDAGYENAYTNPLFRNTATGDYTLLPASPCIGTGHPSSIYNNRDGTRNTRGFTGGPYARVLEDIDDNGVVNILDLITVRNNLNKDPSSGAEAGCDVNRDGKINVLDLIAIRNKLNVGNGLPMWP